MKLDKLLVIYGLGKGGAERVAVTLANGWAADGERIGIVTMTDGATQYPLNSRIRIFPLSFDQSSEHSAAAAYNNLLRISALRALFRDADPGWIVGIGTTMNILSILAAVGIRVNVVATEHTHPPMHALGKAWQLGRSMLYRRAYCVIAPTALTSAWLERHTRPRAALTIPNPISLPLPDTEPTVDPSDLVAPDKSLLLAVGRLGHEKGFDLLIPVFAELAAAHPDWVLVILGEGEQRAELELLIDQHALQHRVMLPGVAGNIASWYQRADLFVMSSRYEGFGYTLAEAMAYGCAAVSFRCDSGPGEIIQSESEGTLVEPADAEALRSALHDLMTDDSRRALVANTGKDAVARFGERVVLERWKELVFESGS